MAKLTGYSKVAAIKFEFGGIYHFALYDDGFDYQPGDTVYTTSNGGKIGKIEEIMTSEEASNRFNENITAEVICKVDTSAYSKRVENRKEAEKIKQKMNHIIKQIDEDNKYEMYAERNPELKRLLEAYKELIY